VSITIFYLDLDIILFMSIELPYLLYFKCNDLLVSIKSIFLRFYEVVDCIVERNYCLGDYGYEKQVYVIIEG
jgi:hypothetical protein